ncbi:MAG: response regulator [Flavobacteriaceae bacterium]|nr:response regulator [Flavobacteriaceae bacterium]
MNKLKVLIVDDDDFFRTILSTIIKKEFNADVFQANSGEQAILLLGEGSIYDVVLCDFDMPHGNGEVVLNHMFLKHFEIPFVLVTSRELFECGTSFGELTKQYCSFSFVHKQSIHKRLHHLIRTILEGS